MTANQYDRIVHVYVENDFAAELSACTPTPNDDGKMAENDARHRIDEALQKWNQQAVGLTFQYEGVLNAESGATACNIAGVKLPAVFVNFRQGCREVGTSCASNGPIVTALRLSSNCSSITVWGDTQTKNSCGATALNWSLRSDSGSNQILQSVMTHEFGHIAGLGHSDDAGATTNAMMNSGTQQFLHLRSWDKDCAETYNNTIFAERQLDRRYMFNTNGGSYGYAATNQALFTTARGEVFGGALDSYYALFDSIYGYIDYDIAPPLGSTVSFANFHAVAPEFLHAHVAPTFWSSYGTFAEPHRAFTLREGNATGVPPLEFDPPYVRESRSSNLFSTTATRYMIFRKPSSQGGNLAWLQTNLPVVTAYDPRSEQNIVVWVDTKHDTRTNGEIYVHPGFESAGILSAGDVLSPSTTTPPASLHPISAYTWDLETDNIVGVACGDESWGWDYNCLLAWQDRGIPWGSVLYTYFRVGNTNNIEWLGSSHIASGGMTSSGVQAAYSNGGFRMAWKGWLNHKQIIEQRSYIGYSSWQGYFRAEERAIDTPTYMYRSHDPAPTPDKNVALTWTRTWN